MPWYQWLYVLVVVAALLRSRPLWRIIPYWCATLTLAAVLPFYPPYWPALLTLLALMRGLSAIEAFVELTIEPHAWPFGARLLLAAWLAAASAVLTMEAFIEAHTGNSVAIALLFRRYFNVWNATWFVIALSFMWIWPNAQRRWKHCLAVGGLLIVEAVESGLKLAKIGDEAFWAVHEAGYLVSVGILLWWTFSGFRALERAHGDPQFGPRALAPAPAGSLIQQGHTAGPLRAKAGARL